MMDGLPLRHRLAYRFARSYVKNAVDSLRNPEVKWVRKKHGEIRRPAQGLWCSMSLFDPSFSSTLFCDPHRSIEHDMWPWEHALVLYVAEQRWKARSAPVAPVAHDELERQLYEFNKHAFWLYPDRWSGPPGVMQFEEDKVPDDRLAGLMRQAAKPAPNHTKFYAVFVAPVVATDLKDGGIHHAKRCASTTCKP